MKIQEIIDYLQTQGTWVNWNQSRDIVLFGETNYEINKIGICWMMTNKALAKAIKEKVNFIITHETAFYEAATAPRRLFYESAQKKKELLKQNNICLYRCHDVWDKIPKVGIADVWSKVIDLPFEPRELTSYNSYAKFSPMSIQEIALKISKALTPYGQDCVQIYGDPKRLITSLVIGTGAAIDINTMLQPGVDAVVISEDGSLTTQDVQYCLDNDIGVIRVNHAQSEIPGMHSMVAYLQEKFLLDVIYLPEGYDMTSVCNCC